jgi:biopolymer transport protein ExbB/TolQ
MQDSSNAFDLAHLRASGDTISRAVAVILVLMPGVPWYWRRLRRATRFDSAEQMERALRQQIPRIHAVLGSGLTFLATTGATGLFVGLFCSVWSIYHALVAIGVSGQAALEKVAGPVGEALIMTAGEQAVAPPAVFACNASTRANRVAMASLAFAHDLHAFFTVGKPFAVNGVPAHSLEVLGNVLENARGVRAEVA